MKKTYLYNQNIEEYLIISDIHANWKVLKNLLKEIKNKKNIKKIIFLGDLIEKNNDSIKVLFKVKDIIEHPQKYGLEKAYLIIGNHEYRFMKYAFQTCVKKDTNNIWYQKSLETNNMELIKYFSNPKNHKELFKILNFLSKQNLFIFINNKYLFTHAFAFPHIEFKKDDNNNIKIKIKNKKYFFTEKQVNEQKDKINNPYNIINIFGHINKGLIKEKDFISIDFSSKEKRKIKRLKEENKDINFFIY